MKRIILVSAIFLGGMLAFGQQSAARQGGNPVLGVFKIIGLEVSLFKNRARVTAEFEQQLWYINKRAGAERGHGLGPVILMT